jgi:hypothetical protein
LSNSEVLAEYEAPRVASQIARLIVAMLKAARLNQQKFADEVASDHFDLGA